MLHVGVLEECSAEEAWQWVFFPLIGDTAYFGDDRDELCKDAVKNLLK